MSLDQGRAVSYIDPDLVSRRHGLLATKSLGPFMRGSGDATYLCQPLAWQRPCCHGCATKRSDHGGVVNRLQLNLVSAR